MKSSNIYFKRWFLAIFALFCLLLNIGAFILFKKNEAVVESQQWVSHTYKVVAQTNTLFTTLQDTLNAQRGYLLSGSAQYLRLYQEFGSRIDGQFTALAELTQDNIIRQDQLKEYREIFDAQRKLMEAQIATMRRTGKVLRKDMDQNRAYMDRIRTLNDEMSQGESDLLFERNRDEQDKQQDFVSTMFATAGVSIVGLLVANGIVSFMAFRRRATEEELVRINKEMEGFTYIASHDLRSPLVNLKGFASEMKTGIVELQPIVDGAAKDMSPQDRQKAEQILKEDIPDALRYIHSSVEKMDKLTNAILELSRIGRRTLKIEEVKPEHVVRHILDTLHHQISSRDISVKVHPMPGVQIDQLALEQVFGNIIDNSIKYLDPARRGEISIGGSRDYRTTTFWVRDNGRGISNHDEHKIFEIYRRGGNHDNVPGEGMGMAYVRTTLRRLGGRIWFEPNKDHGTTFYFTVSNALKKDEA